MDGRHFDRLAKDLATSSNRRRLLRGLTAGVAGAPATQAWHVPAGIVGAALGVVIVRGTGRDG